MGHLRRSPISGLDFPKPRRYDFGKSRRRKTRKATTTPYGLCEANGERVPGDLSQPPKVEKSWKSTKRTRGLYRRAQNEWVLNPFVQMVPYQAQRHGKMVHLISERYPSKDCSGCSYRQDTPLGKRMYPCPPCRMVMGCAENSARNRLTRLGPYPEKNDVLSESSGT